MYQKEAIKWFLGVFIFFISSLSQAAIQNYWALINTDNINSGQCSIGTISGINFRITVSVDDQTFAISDATLERCSGTNFLAPEQLSTLNWAIGLGQGNNGTTLLEGKIPWSIIGNPAQASIIFASDDGTGGVSDIVSLNGNDLNPAWIVQIPQNNPQPQNATPIPTLSNVGVVLLSMFIITALFLFRKHHNIKNNIFQTILVIPIIGILGISIALAATILIDGNATDWPQNTLLTSDNSSDQIGTSSSDILNVYALEDQQNLYVRFDVDLNNVISNSLTLVSASAISNDSAQIDWLTNSNDSTIIYEIHFDENEQFIPSSTTLHKAITNITTTTASTSVENLLPNKQYFVKIRAIDQASNDSWSNELTFLTPALPPAFTGESKFVIDNTNAANQDIKENIITYTLINNADIPKNGDIIVSEEGQGYIRKAIDVSNNNGIISITTESIAINELFDDLDLSFATKFGD